MRQSLLPEPLGNVAVAVFHLWFDTKRGAYTVFLRRSKVTGRGKVYGWVGKMRVDRATGQLTGAHAWVIPYDEKKHNGLVPNQIVSGDIASATPGTSSRFSVIHLRNGTWMFPRCQDFVAREDAERVAENDRKRGFVASVYEWPS